MRRILLFMVIVVSATTLAACGGAGEVDPNEIGDVARGEDIFVTGGEILGTPCKNCHALEEGTDTDRWGPALVGISVRAADRVSGQSSVDYLRESILDPSAYVVDGFEDRMEKFYELLLPEEDIDALVAFMLTQ